VTSDTVAALTVQVPAESELKVTAFPDAPPDAETAYVAPGSAGLGGVELKEMDWADNMTLNVCVTWYAAS
jgi:hypothetical protein